MFENIFSSSASKSGKENEVLLNYAEIAKNRKEMEERKLKEELEKGLKRLGKEAEIQEGVEKAREIMEKEFEHRS